MRAFLTNRHTPRRALPGLKKVAVAPGDWFRKTVFPKKLKEPGGTQIQNRFIQFGLYWPGTIRLNKSVTKKTNPAHAL